MRHNPKSFKGRSPLATIYFLLVPQVQLTQLTKRQLLLPTAISILVWLHLLLESLSSNLI